MTGSTMPYMQIGVVLTILIVFALLLATIAGFVAARVLMHAADTASPHAGDGDER